MRIINFALYSVLALAAAACGHTDVATSPAGITSSSSPSAAPESSSEAGTPTETSTETSTETETVTETPVVTTTVTAQASSTLALLDSLPVKGRAPKTGYSRSEFGEAWTDDVNVAGGHNGCDTRNDILQRDLTEKVMRNSCTVQSGVLHDPYTGKIINFTRGKDTSADVQIDHIVALSNAWQTGAQQLDFATRTALANDPDNLVAVDGPTNQQKSDYDAASWLPPNKEYRCTYVEHQVIVKARYNLWVTQAEKDAIQRVLESC